MATQEELTRRIQEAAARQAEIRAAQSTAADAAASAAAYSGTAQAASGDASQSATNSQQSAQAAETYATNAASYAANAAAQADRAADIAASLEPLKAPLDKTQPLRNMHVYTTQVAGAVDLSMLQLAVTTDRVTKCEIWVDYVSGGVTWPLLWSWVDDIEPSAALIGSHYIVELFSDGAIAVARLKLSYTVPAQQ